MFTDCQQTDSDNARLTVQLALCPEAESRNSWCQLQFSLDNTEKKKSLLKLVISLVLGKTGGYNFVWILVEDLYWNQGQIQYQTKCKTYQSLLPFWSIVVNNRQKSVCANRSDVVMVLTLKFRNIKCILQNSEQIFEQFS